MPNVNVIIHTKYYILFNLHKLGVREEEFERLGQVINNNFNKTYI